MAQPLPVFRSDVVSRRLAHRLCHGYLKTERPRPVNGSQREGCKRLLAKVNGVDAQVQQEAPRGRVLGDADFLAAVPQAFSSHASLLFEADEYGVEMLAARCCPLGDTSSPWRRRAMTLDSTSLEGVSSLRGREPLVCCGCFVAGPFFNRLGVPTTCSLTTCSLNYMYVRVFHPWNRAVIRVFHPNFTVWSPGVSSWKNSPGSQAPVDETGSQKPVEGLYGLIPLPFGLPRRQSAAQGQGRGPQGYSAN